MPRISDPNVLHPSLNFRYSIISSKLPGSILYAKSATLPSLTQNAISINHINDSMKVKGRTNWNPITFDCYTFELITITDIWAYILKHQLVEDAIDMNQDSYKSDFTMTVLTPEMVPINIWSIKDAFITDAKFGDLDWGGNDIINVSLTIEYDYAMKVI